MTLVELMLEMAQLSSERLQEKRFGKRRMAQADSDVGVGGEAEARIHSDVGAGRTPADGGGERRTRYIPRAVKHAVWARAGGKCSACGSRHRLEYDHVQPYALDGGASPENIQLLCASCNLRRGVKTFGLSAMRRS